MLRWVSLLLLVFAVAMLALGIFRAVQAESAVLCFSERDREHVRELTLMAINQAFTDHVENLFSVWVKDFSPEPKRAMAGMANGISAFHRARANAMQWSPPLCP